MSSSKHNDSLRSMEEGRSKSCVKGVGHDHQRQTHQLESTQPSNRNIQIQCASLRNKFKSLEDAVSEDNKEDKRPRIQRVSHMLRGDDGHINKYFEPRMVSIGPLHHGDKFKLAEKLKLKLAAQFIKEHNLDDLCLYNKIKDRLENLKKRYFKEDVKGFEEEDLVWMFLIDGCALMHYIHYATNGRLTDLKIKMDMAAFAQQDLFVLENQLPYEVLDVLITSTADKEADDLQKSICKFIDDTASIIRGTRLSQPAPSTPNPAHLLELLWRRLVGPDDNAPRQSQATATLKNQPYRNVNELKAAWVEFKSDEAGGPLKNISFASPYWFTGTLTLPSLLVDDSTEPMFLNLIAFEMCPDFENDFQVSSYISFLDSLIDQADDVKELRKANIIYNALGSDEVVARLFNEIGTDIVPNENIYSKVKEDIQRHCEKKYKTWMAQGINDHFSSPWTFLAFGAAIAALAMSFVQTWYTVYPAKSS